MNARTWKRWWDQYGGLLGVLVVYTVVGAALSMPYHWLVGDNAAEFTLTLLALPVIVVLLIIVIVDIRSQQMTKMCAGIIVGLITVTIGAPMLVHLVHGGTFITVLGYVPLGFFSIIGSFVIALIMVCLTCAVDYGNPEP